MFRFDMVGYRMLVGDFLWISVHHGLFLSCKKFPLVGLTLAQFVTCEGGSTKLRNAGGILVTEL